MAVAPGGQWKTAPLLTAAGETGAGDTVDLIGPNEGGPITAVVEIEGISGDTVTMQASNDNTNWYGILFTNLTSGAEAATITADGLYRATVIGVKKLRANVTSYSAGTITAKVTVVA